MNAPADGNGTLACRELPHNIAAEKSLLGGILIDNKGFERVSEFLLREHFALVGHGTIYHACAGIIGRGLTANPISLETALKDDEDFIALGGPAYLVDLVYAGTTPIGTGEYGRIVLDTHERRELIHLGEDMLARAYSGDATETAREVREAHEPALFEMAESGHTESGPRPFSHFTTQALDQMEAARSGGSPGVQTGFVDLDTKLGGLHPSDLIILAGRPSMGKSALAGNIARNAANAGVGVGFFSLEMSGEQLAGRELAGRCKLGPHLLRTGKVNEYDASRLRQAGEDTRDLPLFIDDTPSLSVAALRTRVRRLKRRHGIGLVIVDYLQLMVGQAESKQVEISNISRGLKAVAKETGLPVLALSQLSRAVESRPDKRPQLSDLRESGAIEQDADVVMFIYREAYYLGPEAPKQREGEPTKAFADRLVEWEKAQGVAEVIVAKHRHGPTGNVFLHFNADTVRFESLLRGPT